MTPSLHQWKICNSCEEGIFSMLVGWGPWQFFCEITYFFCMCLIGSDYFSVVSGFPGYWWSSSTMNSKNTFSMENIFTCLLWWEWFSLPKSWLRKNKNRKIRKLEFFPRKKEKCLGESRKLIERLEGRVRTSFLSLITKVIGIIIYTVGDETFKSIVAPFFFFRRSAFRPVLSSPCSVVP